MKCPLCKSLLGKKEKAKIYSYKCPKCSVEISIKKNSVYDSKKELN